MSLTKEQIDTTKRKALAAVHKAMRGHRASSVAELHKRAIEAADDVRGPNELAYVTVSIASKDDSAFSVVIDLSSDKGDAFHIDYAVKSLSGGLEAIFVRSGDVAGG